MRFRSLLFAAVVGGACYVLGTRAGRGQYRTMKRSVKAWTSPATKTAQKRVKKLAKQLKKVG
ncbi:hypothetical protein SAMN04489806_1219 [Paramicrobacterium humi]|uniref:YtxH domain-containing protein n=1 Tax=Paramicrobacterium humi TaxID=640635 RepID=A0A1H4KMF0_9MICO|nr:hypothetical protein [Microbacterium humi]SEB59426.1 hypothetical protein SAMN04489806_1219 [Microbacterium humi]